jgi:Spy/CpxP family protein refolding chaperone
MKKGIILFGVVIAFMLCTALPGQAQRYWRQGMSPSYGMDLTSEQITKIRELTLAFQKDILPMENELQSLYMEVESQPYGSSGQAKLDAIYQKIDNLELALEKKYMEHDEKIRSLLTDKQKMLYNQWGGLGYGLESMVMGMGERRGYADYGRGYGRGYLGYGRGFGRGYFGYGRGYTGYGRGYTGYGRGYAGYGRGFAGFGRGFGPGWGPGMGRAWSMGRGMGRGYWCPWFQRGRFNMMRNWWW